MANKRTVIKSKFTFERDHEVGHSIIKRVAYRHGGNSYHINPEEELRADSIIRKLGYGIEAGEDNTNSSWTVADCLATSLELV